MNLNTFNYAVISCGASKKSSGYPMQAYKVYEGGYYHKMLNLASRLAPNVLILSAGYGLLNANDLIENYDRKMTPRQAKEWKREGKIFLPKNTVSLMGEVYNSAISNVEDVHILLPASIGRMGYKMQYAMQLAEQYEVIANLDNLPHGELKTLLFPEAKI